MRQIWPINCTQMRPIHTYTTCLPEVRRRRRDNVYDRRVSQLQQLLQAELLHHMAPVSRPHLVHLPGSPVQDYSAPMSVMCISCFTNFFCQLPVNLESTENDQKVFSLHKYHQNLTTCNKHTVSTWGTVQRCRS